jgi:cellulose synthase operon protein C
MRGWQPWVLYQRGMNVRPRKYSAILVMCCLLAAIDVCQAAGIDYDTRRDAALRRCDDARYRGQVEAGRDCYRPLLRTGNALTRAEAAWALGDLRNANEYFKSAVTDQPRSPLPRVRWARLFLEAGQHADAIRLFQEALEIAPKDSNARLGMIAVTLDRFDGDVDKAIAELIAEDPSSIEAQLLGAKAALERGQADRATTYAERAMQLVQQQQRPPLEAQTVLAAIEVLRNRNPEQATRAALNYNPRYGAIYEALARLEVNRRRYREANDWLQRAVDVQPDLWSARRELGLNLMRLGKADAARPHLVAAFEGDPFSTTTVNTLRLLDSLSQFERISIAQPQLSLQLHKKESAALAPYVSQVASDSMRVLSQRYGYTPTEPVTVEIYPDHDDFAVRTAGLPGIGLLGVTFGHVVAMDSPSGRKTGEFHWGSTLWHEMAHVFTLSVTDHRVPRWLSEGLSVYEEWTSGPTPGVSITPDVLGAFAAGKLLPVVTLDDGFMRPTYEGQVQISYMQAGLMCLFAAERWGLPKMVEFLRAFSKDPPIAEAVRASFKIEPAQWDAEFQAYMRKRFAPYLADPKRFPELLRRAHTMLEARNWTNAREAANAAILMLPEFTAEGSAYEVLAAAEEGAGNTGAAIAAWQAWRKAGGWDPTAMRKYGALLLGAGRKSEASDVLAAVNLADPLSPQGHDQLGQLLLEQNQVEFAKREYEVLLALQPADTAVPHFGLARAYRLSGDKIRARQFLLESLDVAPNFRPAQKLLLEMIGDRTP